MGSNIETQNQIARAIEKLDDAKRYASIAYSGRGPGIVNYLEIAVGRAELAAADLRDILEVLRGS